MLNEGENLDTEANNPFTFINRLGEGAFGVVDLCQYNGADLDCRDTQ